MSRLMLGTSAGLLLAVGMTTLASAADLGGHGPVFRPAYDLDWSQPDPLGFEAGLRYVYSTGAQRFSLGGRNYTGDDHSHIVEGHFRIDDYSTASYLKGSLGFAAHISNQVSLPGGSGRLEGGRIASFTGDFGMTPFGTENARFGGFIGYLYSNDSPDMGRENFFLPETVSWVTGSPTYTIGGDSSPNNIDIHALRLGVTAKADLGPQFDITADVAAIPYAWVTGTLGAHGIPTVRVPGSTIYPSSAVGIDGHLYGGAAELMVGFHPTEHLTIRVGGRAQYLTGPVNYTYSTAQVTDPFDSTGGGTIDQGPTTASQSWIGRFTNFEMFRWGPAIELTGRF